MGLALDLIFSALMTLFMPFLILDCFDEIRRKGIEGENRKLEIVGIVVFIVIFIWHFAYLINWMFF